jgi:hypothetical protein
MVQRAGNRKCVHGKIEPHILDIIFCPGRGSPGRGQNMEAKQTVNAVKEKLLASIKCFRGIRSLEAEIAPLTIVTGRNNAGKSSFLEALAIATALNGRLALAREEDPVLYIVSAKRLRSPSELINKECKDAVHMQLKTINGTPILSLNLYPAKLPGKDWAKRLSMLIANELRRCLEKKIADAHLGAVGHAAAYTLLAVLLSSFTGKPLAASAQEVNYPLPPSLRAIFVDTLTRYYGVIITSQGSIPIEDKNITNYINYFYSIIDELLLKGAAIAELQGNDSNTSLQVLYLSTKNINKINNKIYDIFTNIVLFLLDTLLSKVSNKLYINTIHTRLIEKIDDLRVIIKDCLRKTFQHFIGERRIILAQKTCNGCSTSKYRTVFLLRRRRVDPLLIGNFIEFLFNKGLLHNYRLILRKLKIEDIIIKPEGAYVRLHNGPVPVSLLGDGMIELMEILAGAI